MICKFKKHQTEHQSLTPVILVPWEVGGWGWEAYGLKPTQAETSRDPISINNWTECCAPVIPSYSGGWDWEDHSSKPAWARNCCETPFSTKRKKKIWAWWPMPVILVTTRNIKQNHRLNWPWQKGKRSSKSPDPKGLRCGSIDGAPG
jgi:hypothetical protein